MRRIVCFGDSNTHGTIPFEKRGAMQRFGPTMRWPRVMLQALSGEWELVEEGLPGRTTVHDDQIEGAHRNGLTVLPAIIESHQTIDLMVLMLGTNDCKQRFSLTGIDIALGVRRLAEMIIASPLVEKLLIISPVPLEETGCLAEIFQGGAKRSRDLLDHLREVADELDVAFLDAGELIKVSPVDGVHFSETEHATLGKAVAKQVQELFA